MVDESKGKPKADVYDLDELDIADLSSLADLAFDEKDELSEPEVETTVTDDNALPETGRMKEMLDLKEQQYRRLAADFENFRRRQQQEKEEFFKFASEKLIVGILPIMDNFDRALQAASTASDVEAVTSGIEMIFRQFQETLTKFGVSPIEATGQLFDPQQHEAVMQVPNDEVPDQTVVAELQKGYTLHGKVIRPSMVQVSTSST